MRGLCADRLISPAFPLSAVEEVAWRWVGRWEWSWTLESDLGISRRRSSHPGLRCWGWLKGKISGGVCRMRQPPSFSPPQYSGWNLLEDGSIRIEEATEDALGTYTCVPYNALGTMGQSPPARLVLKVSTLAGGGVLGAAGCPPMCLLFSTYLAQTYCLLP